MKARWRVPRTTLRPHFDSLWLSIRRRRAQCFVKRREVGFGLPYVEPQTQASESRFRNGIKHLGASLRRRLSPAFLKAFALRTERWME
jgi:hypothetical protein